MTTLYDNDNFFAAYQAMPRSQNGLAAAGEWHQLQSLFPPLAGKTVLDLGCGYGWHCEYAAQQGAASVLGIDASVKMIAEARHAHALPQIRYEVGDLLGYEYPAETYDLVVSNLVLHYISELPPLYAKIWRTLKPGGTFLFNIEHPTFTAGVHQEWICDDGGNALYWPVDDYFLPGPRETIFLGERVTKHHHTLTQILAPLLALGFRLTAVEEAMPPESMRDLPEMRDELRRPMMLLVRAEKNQ